MLKREFLRAPRSQPCIQGAPVSEVAILWLVGFNTLLGRSIDPGSGSDERKIRGMSATLMYVGIGAVLATGVAILTIAVLFFKTARRYVDLTERREKLREMVGNTRGRRQGEESPRSRRPEGLDRHVQETSYKGSSSEVGDEEQRWERTPKANQ